MLLLFNTNYENTLSKSLLFLIPTHFLSLFPLPSHTKTFFFYHQLDTLSTVHIFDTLTETSTFLSH